MTTAEQCPRCKVSFKLRKRREHDRFECDRMLRNRLASLGAAMPRVDAPAAAAPPVTHKPSAPPVTHGEQKSGVTHSERTKGTRSKGTGAARQARYRAKHADAYRQRHRDLMRRRRAAARAAAQAGSA
jgi:hypothetical protein